MCKSETRGRRAVRWNRGKRCDGMWVFPHCPQTPSFFQSLITGWCWGASRALCISHSCLAFFEHIYLLVYTSPRKSVLTILSTWRYISAPGTPPAHLYISILPLCLGANYKWHRHIPWFMASHTEQSQDIMCWHITWPFPVYFIPVTARKKVWELLEGRSNFLMDWFFP